MATTYNVNFTVGTNEDLNHRFQLKDTAGAGIDITGASMALSAVNDNEDEVFSASTGDARITLTAPATGFFKLLVPQSVIGALAPGAYRFDLVMTLSGEATRLMFGTVNVVKGYA